MTRDQGPQRGAHMVTRSQNDGNRVSNGVCLPPRDLPEPTNAQNLFDSLDDIVLRARWPAFALALIFLAGLAGYFFNR